MRTQTSVDNTVNDLRYESNIENCVKDKNNFFIMRNIIKNNSVVDSNCCIVYLTSRFPYLTLFPR